jgi:hypothetical protein
MPVTDSGIGWANNLVNDPITGEPNRREIAEEMRDSGLSSDQGLSRQIFNEINHTLAEGILTVQQEAADNLQTAIDAEEAARIVADNQLQTKLNTEYGQLKSNLDAEEASRIAGDDALANTLTTTETNLQTQLTALSDALNALQDKVIPKVGDTWITKSQESPATRFGVGTWNLIKGRMLIGLDEEDSDFDLTGKTGGVKTHTHNNTFTVQSHTLTEAQVPTYVHNHDYRDRYHAEDSGQTQTAPYKELMPSNYNDNTGSDGTDNNNTYWLYYNTTTESDTFGGGESHTHGLSGGVSTTATLPPYEVVYIWERVA